MKVMVSDHGLRSMLSVANLTSAPTTTIDFKSFSAQYDTAIPNVDEMRRKFNKPPSGQLIVHLLDNPSFEVDYYQRETVKSLKERISKISNINIFNYNIVCKNGTMNDDQRLDDFKLKPHTRIILVEKGAVSAQRKLTRERWLESSKCRSCGVSRTDLNFLNDLGPYKKTKLKVKSKPKENSKLQSVETFFNELTLDQI